MKLSQRINEFRHNLVADMNLNAKHARREFNAGTGIYSDSQKSEKHRCPHCGRTTRPNTFVCPHCGTSLVSSDDLFSIRAMQAEAKAAFAVRAERILYGSRNSQGNPQKRQRYLNAEDEAALLEQLVPAVA